MKQKAWEGQPWMHQKELAQWMVLEQMTGQKKVLSSRQLARTLVWLQVALPKVHL
jgi:hypothetical protein